MRDPVLSLRLSFAGSVTDGPSVTFDRTEIEGILHANGYRNLRHAGPGAHDHSWLCDDDRDEGYNVHSVLREILRRRVFAMLTTPQK